MKKNIVRQVLLIVVSIFNWVFSVGYVRDVYIFMKAENMIEYVDNMYIDGSDFAPFANLAILGVNGLIIILSVILSVLLGTIFILIFATLLRVITIRKNDIVTASEVIFTKRVIVISSVLAFIAGVLFTNINLIWCVVALSWQQPLFMMLIYYLPLRKRFKKGVEIDYSEPKV